LGLVGAKPYEVSVESLAVGQGRNPEQVKSKPRIDGFALQCKDAEDTVMDSVERLAGDEPLERLDAEGELSQREGALVTEAAGSQAARFASAVYSGP